MYSYTFLIFHIGLNQTISQTDMELESIEHAEQLHRRLKQELGDGYEISYYENVGGN